jgi:cytochrome c-type biogenesis protein CcmH
MKKILSYLTIIFLFNTHAISKISNKDEIEILKNVRCLVCQGQSIADSNSDFAQTIKLVVKDKISEGKTKKEIYSFLISKYGEWIVFDTQVNRKNFLLWFLPYLSLLLGGLIIFAILKKRREN